MTVTMRIASYAVRDLARSRWLAQPLLVATSLVTPVSLAGSAARGAGPSAGWPYNRRAVPVPGLIPPTRRHRPR